MIIEHTYVSKMYKAASRYQRNIYLYIALLIVGVLSGFAVYALAKPQYVSQAVIGPPGPSPANQMFATMGLASGGSLASRALSGLGGSNANDPYQEYLQLLPSSRLSKVLITRDHLLPIIFRRMWDIRTKRWKVGFYRRLINRLDRALNRPVSEGPGIGALNRFLHKNLSVSYSQNGQPPGLIPAAGGYMVVSFLFDNRDKAERILNIILKETDRIIRDEQRRDVRARIKFLRKILLRNDIATEERSTLINILSSQEQLLMVIQADKRYAFTLVSAPYASKKPVYPYSLPVMLFLGLLGGSFGWIMIVVVAPRVSSKCGILRRLDARHVSTVRS